MHYYGTRLSENISKREPEGYLLCLNVPVARTGTQEYLPAEIGLPGGGEPVPVFRPPEEVFSPEAIASFEGMPVTNDHPPEGVDISNIHALQKGHAHNVRRGSGENAEIVATILVKTVNENNSICNVIKGNVSDIREKDHVFFSSEDMAAIPAALSKGK